MRRQILYSTHSSKRTFRSSMAICHYQTLGLTKQAKETDIRSAYLALAKQWHPDVNQSKDASNRFTSINAAYQILSDKSKKSEYDRQIGNRASQQSTTSNYGYTNRTNHNSNSNKWYSGGYRNPYHTANGNTKQRTASSSSNWWNFEFYGSTNGNRPKWDFTEDFYGDWSRFASASQKGPKTPHDSTHGSGNGGGNKGFNDEKMWSEFEFEFEESENPHWRNVRSHPRSSKYSQRRSKKQKSNPNNTQRQQSQQKHQPTNNANANANANANGNTKTEASKDKTNDSTDDSTYDYTSEWTDFDQEAFWRFVRNTNKDKQSKKQNKKQNKANKSEKNNSNKNNSGKPKNPNSKKEKSSQQRYKKHNKSSSSSSSNISPFDIELNMDLDFLDAVRGCTRQISFERNELCLHCKGMGVEPNATVMTCNKCNGSGEVFTYGNDMATYACPNCHGKGVIMMQCMDCNGNSTVAVTKQLTVTLPSGLRSGDRVRVAKQGHCNPLASILQSKPKRGKGKDDSGHVWIKCTVKDHDEFSRKKNNIHVCMELPFSLAILGGAFVVPTIHGPTVVKVMPATKTGDYEVIPTKGVYDSTSEKRGDQFVHFVVTIPENISDEQRKLLTMYARLESEPIATKPDAATIKHNTQHYHTMGRKLKAQKIKNDQNFDYRQSYRDRRHSQMAFDTDTDGDDDDDDADIVSDEFDTESDDDDDDDANTEFKFSDKPNDNRTQPRWGWQMDEKSGMKRNGSDRMDLNEILEEYADDSNLFSQLTDSDDDESSDDEFEFDKHLFSGFCDDDL